MINNVFYKTRNDGVKLYRIYSDTTPKIKQLPTGIVYDCWVYKTDKNGNPTNNVDWDISGVIDIESASYTYEEYNED